MAFRVLAQIGMKSRQATAPRAHIRLLQMKNKQHAERYFYESCVCVDLLHQNGSLRDDSGD